MEIFLRPLLYVLSLALDFLFWCVLINVILSWLMAFGVLNSYNRFVDTLVGIIHRITEPLLQPLRRVLPQVGGIDFSPFVLVLIIIFLQRLIIEIMLKLYS
jgi:YggT family protein